MFSLNNECQIPVGSAVYLINETAIGVECGVCVGVKYMVDEGYTYFVTDAGRISFSHPYKDEDIGTNVFPTYEDAEKELKTREAKENGDTVSD